MKVGFMVILMSQKIIYWQFLFLDEIKIALAIHIKMQSAYFL